MRKKTGLSFRDWLRTDEVLGYVINAYEGVEAAPTNPRVMRRVFLWEEDAEVKMGNAEAFALHLGRHFDRRVSAGDASLIHELLRELGEAITPHPRHARPRVNSPNAGRFKQPDPDEWVVRHREPKKKK